MGTVNVNNAFRSAIRDQTHNFKRRYFKYRKKRKCPVSGIMIYWKITHVDHKYPYTFASLLNAYCEKFGIVLEEQELEWVRGRPRLPKKDAKKFAKFHKKNCRLRCIYWKSNLKQPNTSNFAGRKVKLKF